MNAKRVFWLMSGLVILLGGLTIGGVVLGNIVLQKQANKLFELKLQNKVLDEQQVALLRANKDVQKYAELEQIAKTIVPQDKDQAKAVRQIVNIAAASGISLKSISFPTSTLGQAVVVTPTQTGATTPKAVANSSNLTQVKPVEGMVGVYSMEITVTSDDTKPVSYRSFLDFLTRLEQNRRTAQVGTISIQPNTKAPDSLSFNITVNVYIKP
jgi:hypothetical protein